MKLARMILLPVALTLVLSGCGGGKSNVSSTQSTATGEALSPSTGTTPSTVAPASHEVSPGVVRASAGGVTATMHASSHRPRVGILWPVSFTVVSAGKPAKAEVRYEYLFAGQVVARRSHYKFEGTFHDTFNWPPSAVGYPLTFRAVISSEGATLNLDYPVQVTR